MVGTGKPNWWIVGAQRWHPVKYDNSAQPAKLYLATWEATTVDGNPFNDAMLTPLPVAPLRAGQLIDGTADGSSVRQLAAATVSPDGKRLALVITQGDTYQVSVYPVTGHAVTRTWSGGVSPTLKHFEWGFSLTWLSDNKTLGFGVGVGAATGNAMVDSTAAVGLWVFSARTGTLTAAWNRHTICCALSSTDFPHILWVSPHGDLLIADGMSTENQGAQLFLRTADGTLKQLPWKGLIHRPNQANIIEPSIAW